MRRARWRLAVPRWAGTAATRCCRPVYRSADFSYKEGAFRPPRIPRSHVAPSHPYAAFSLSPGFRCPPRRRGKRRSWPATPEAPAEPAPPSRRKPRRSRSQAGAVTSKTYGAWSLRCGKAASEAAEGACEISQTIESPDQSGPIAKISVGRRKPGDPLHIVIILPNNVSFPSYGAPPHRRRTTNGGWSSIGSAAFRAAVSPTAELSRCRPSQHWHGLNGMGSIVFRDAAGDEISLPMSFDGFGEALDALNKS